MQVNKLNVPIQQVEYFHPNEPRPPGMVYPGEDQHLVLEYPMGFPVAALPWGPMFSIMIGSGTSYVIDVAMTN